MENAFTTTESEKLSDHGVIISESNPTSNYFIKHNKSIHNSKKRGYQHNKNKCNIFSDKNLFELVDSTPQCNKCSDSCEPSCSSSSSCNNSGENCKEEINKLKNKIEYLCCKIKQLEDANSCRPNCNDDDYLSRILYLEDNIRALKNVIFSLRTP